MDKYTLPTKVQIREGVVCEINSDYRQILKVFKIFNDPDLIDNEKIILGLRFFYKGPEYFEDLNTAISEMMNFINMCEPDGGGARADTDKPVLDWEQDFSLIIAPINKILNTDVRGLEYLHWWTFLSAFMQIGESTFSTYVGIRDKLNRGIKLEKHEQRIYDKNKHAIDLKVKYDSTTQAFMDAIMGG